jgi:hypothetical protein
VPPPQAPEDREPQAKRPRWIVIGIAAAIVIGIVIAIATSGGGGEAAHARTPDAAVAAIAPVAVPVAKSPPVPIDAAAVAAIVVDAAPAIAIDAAVPAAVVPEHVEPPSPVDAFAKANERGDYGVAVALCVKNAELVRSSCTLAACRAHEQAHARRWFVASGSRPSLAAACKAAGTIVEPAKEAPPRESPPKDKDKPKKDCEADPMACQH